MAPPAEEVPKSIRLYDRKFEVDKSEFIHTVQVSYGKPFTVTEGIIDGVRDKGKYAIMTEPDTFFPFFKLPIELRRHILSMCLQERKNITILVPATQDHNEPKKAKRRQAPGGRLRSNRTSSLDRKELSPLSILRVNKQFGLEAASIAYGMNTFKFNDTPDLKVFLDNIQGMKKYIKHIKLKSVTLFSRSNTVVFGYLENMANVRTIEIPHKAVCKALYDLKYRTPRGKAILGTLKAILPSLHAIKQQEGRSGQILGLFKVVPDADDECLRCIVRGSACEINRDNYNYCQNHRPRCATLTKFFTKYIAKLLDIET